MSHHATIVGIVTKYLRVLLTALNCLAIVIALNSHDAFAQTEQLFLSWQDNATNEDGFIIERSAACAGPWTVIISNLPANSTTYTDTNLAQGQTFSYQVKAFNAGGVSSYSNCATGTTQAQILVTKTGTGTGNIVSNPTGISCGTTCSGKFPGKSSVVLTAQTAVGSQFVGWSGACSGSANTCTLVMDGQKSVTAMFNVMPGPNGAPSNLVVKVAP